MTRPKIDGPFGKLSARLLGTRRNGWRPRPYDKRDHVAEQKHQLLAAAPALPRVFSMRAAALDAQCPVDQLSEGSCVANAILDSIVVAEAHLGIATRPLRSRNFLYYNARLAYGLPVSDDGCDPRVAVDALRRYGAPHEADWPYVVGKVNKQPSATAYMKARPTQGVGYSFVASRSEADIARAVKAAIFANKTPVPFGLMVGDTFDECSGPELVVPPHPASYRGGHYVSIVGWDDTLVPGETVFEVLNSWGDGWGDGGFAFLTQAYVCHPTSGDYMILSNWHSLQG